MFEAFKTGQVDLWPEEDPRRWANGYDFPAVKDGRVVKRDFDIGLPAGMTALVFNTRRKVFADPRVREALIYLFDFEWINRTLYAGLYSRTQSYFERSILASAGRPADARERAAARAVCQVREAGDHGRAPTAFLRPTEPGATARTRREAFRLLEGGRLRAQGRQARRQGDAGASSSSRSWPPRPRRRGCS